MDIIQCAFGFEIEFTNWEVAEASSEEMAASPSKDFTSLKKYPRHHPILLGKDWELQAENSGENVSVVEAVSKAFEDSPQGFEEMIFALQEIERACNIITEKAPLLSLQCLENAGIGRLMEPMAILKQVRVAGLAGKPQVTIGVSMDKVHEFLLDLGAGGQPETEAQIKKKDWGRRLTGWDILQGYRVNTFYLGQASRISSCALALFANEFPDGHPLKEPSIELKGFTDLVVMYLIYGTKEIKEYPKAFTKLLARTDFASMAKLIPKHEKDALSADNSALWIELMKLVGSQDSMKQSLLPTNHFEPVSIRYFPQIMNPEIELEKPLFEKGVYNNRKKYANMPPDILAELTRKMWLQEMMQGKDLLTSEHFPNPEAKTHIEALGGFGGKLDMLATNGKEAPIFELRSLNMEYNFNSLRELLQQLFAYMIALHQNMDYNIGDEFPPYFIPSPESSSSSEDEMA